MIERNWAGNYIYQAAVVHRPQTVEQIQDIVGKAKKIKARGTRHSFNDIADSSGELVSTENLNRVIGLDRMRRTVAVEAGVRYGELGQYLHREGFALRNLASLPHISVAGAVATATHGAGETNGNLATAVRAMEIVKADGRVVTVSSEKDGANFEGMVVSLGALGVVTKLTLDIIPAFSIRQDVCENLSLEQLENNFDAIQASGYSVSFFTDWTRPLINQVWLKRFPESAPPLSATFYGAAAARADRHPIAAVSAENCTQQMGRPGPWHERLPHFRLDFTPSSGEELQSEYNVPRARAIAAIMAIAQLREQIAPLLLICEIRAIAADMLWLSPCYRRPCVAIHFTWKQDWPAVRRLLPIIEETLAPFEARPHWGKLFTMSPRRLQVLYEKLPDFRQLALSFDPQGKFRNAFLDAHVFAAEAHG
jgi:alditol oxidase